MTRAVSLAASGAFPVHRRYEATTEPSDAEVAAHLKSTGILNYPVALDTTGRIADGYQVQDQPWLALVNSSGKITWWHDGWVPLSALEKVAITHSR